MKIEVLGPGCAKCKLLAERTEEAAKGLGADFTLVKVTEYPDIVARGVMTTPGLVVDGVVKSQGHVPTVAAIRELLR
ncbi:redox-active disulfide protein 2 [Geothrix limicola]|uniref:Redox-active disulfide protein 2 n=1 Tax=Geothrix limicola TaxID=2927978 RepID=A0ABQ5QI15_9BACT|nr:thioredoxin family protein [Geothrix limicola]GLH74337.1 redox-active disulfide protein 2 [Geothrix limicola]